MSATARAARDRFQAPRQRAITARDAGLKLASRANRWLICGAVALAGGLSALTAHAFHSRTAAAPNAAAPNAAAATTAAPQSSQPSSQTPLQSPSQPPSASSQVPAPAPAPAVSGGS